MAGDLEDFLRRAAERRKAKAGQQPPQRQQQPQRQAPPARRAQTEYTDRRAERIVRPEPEEILVAEVVEDPLAERKRRLEEAKKAAAKARAEAAQKTRSIKTTTTRPKSSGTAPALTGDMVSDLLRTLQRPGGVQQAILLREILDRPEHRW